MEQEVIRLRSHITKTQAELQASIDDRLNLAKELEEHNARQHTLQKHIEKLHANLKESRARMAEIKRKSSREVHDITKDRREWSSRLAVAENEAKRYETLYTAAKRELARIAPDYERKLAERENAHTRELNAIRDRSTAAEAAATAAEAAATAFRMRLSVVMGGAHCEHEQVEAAARLKDQSSATFKELAQANALNQRLNDEVKSLRTAVAERVSERDSALKTAQSSKASLVQAQAELRSCRANLSKLKEQTGCDMRLIARLRSQVNEAQSALEKTQSNLDDVQAARQKLEHAYASTCDECDANTATITALQQAKREAESNCCAARRRAAKADIRLIKEQHATFEAAETQAARALEAIVREKHDMKRAIDIVENEKRVAKDVVRRLTERCIFLVSELRAAATAENTWREERVLLRAALQDTHHQLSEVQGTANRSMVRHGNGSGFEELHGINSNLFDCYTTAEQAAVDALRCHAMKYTRLIVSDLATIVPHPSRLVARQTLMNPEWTLTSRKSSSWEIQAEDPNDADATELIQRFDFRGFLQCVSENLEQIAEQGRDNSQIEPLRDKIQSLIAAKLAEVATCVRCVETACASQCAKLHASLVAVSAELAKFRDSPAAASGAVEAKLEAQAKKDAVIAHTKTLGKHALELCIERSQGNPHQETSPCLVVDLAGLRVDDETCMCAARALASPDQFRVKDAWCVEDSSWCQSEREKECPAEIVDYDNQHNRAFEKFKGTITPNMRPLEFLLRLTLSDNAVGDIGAGCLAETIVPAAPFLVMLDLSRNLISAVGRNALERGVKSNKTVLHFAVTNEVASEKCATSLRKQEQLGGVVIVGWRVRQKGSDWNADSELEAVEGAMATASSCGLPSLSLIVDIRQNMAHAHPGVSVAALRAVTDIAPIARAAMTQQAKGMPERTDLAQPSQLGTQVKHPRDSNLSKRPKSAPDARKNKGRANRTCGPSEFDNDVAQTALRRRFKASDVSQRITRAASTDQRSKRHTHTVTAGCAVHSRSAGTFRGEAHNRQFRDHSLLANSALGENLPLQVFKPRLGSLNCTSAFKSKDESAASVPHTASTWYIATAP